jgi:hypothetical protein
MGLKVESQEALGCVAALKLYPVMILVTKAVKKHTRLSDRL